MQYTIVDDKVLPLSQDNMNKLDDWFNRVVQSRVSDETIKTSWPREPKEKKDDPV